MKIPCVHIVRTDSYSLLNELMDMTQLPCEVTVCSYAITEVWMRGLCRMKETGRISHLRMLLDFDVMNRHREKLFPLKDICDELYLTSSHAKMMLLHSGDFDALAIMSANCTNNYRIESYYVTDRRDEIEDIGRDLAGVLSEAVRIS